MKRISMMVGAAALVVVAPAPAGANPLQGDAGFAAPAVSPSGRGEACSSGPLTFETLDVTTKWSAKTLRPGRKASVTVTVSRRGPQRLTANELPQTPEIDQPVGGARVMTAIYLSSGHRWAVGETDENGRVTFYIPLPRTKARSPIAATGADLAIGPRIDCGVSEVGYAQDRLRIRR